MTSITQTINSYIGGISQQPDEKKLPGQLVTAKNVLPDVTEGLMKRPGSKLIASLSDGSANSVTHGKWFHYYRDENEQYIGQISRDGVLRMWDCATGSEKTVTNNLNLTSNSATYARNTSGVITVTLANHGFTQVGQIVNLDFTSGTAVDDVYSITGVTSTSVFTVKDSTTAATTGNVTVKTNYLYHLTDADLQTLTLNDYTYITNRNTITKMKDLLSGSYDGVNNYNGAREPEAYVELKKVAYASQYALNIYDDDTLEDVTTATRVSVKRVLDSSNTCSTSAQYLLPASGTLPGSSGYTGRCAYDGTETNSAEADSYCPNVDTRIINFAMGAAWDATDSNGATGSFSFWRGGTEQTLFERQRLSQYTVAPSKVYKLSGSSITDLVLPATSATATSATINAVLTLIKDHANYGKDNTGAADKWTIKAENITAPNVEVQTSPTIATDWNYEQHTPTEFYWNVNGTEITTSKANCGPHCHVAELQAHADYASLDATVSITNTIYDDDCEIIFTFKNPGTQPSKCKIGMYAGDHPNNLTCTTTTDSIEKIGDLAITFDSSGDKGICSLVNVTDSNASTAFVKEASSSNLANPPKDLYLRITTTGQAVPESGATNPKYHCRYTTTHDLLYGGQNWEVGDYFEVWMKNAKYRITVDEISTSRVLANRGLIRPTPTSFDTKTVVTAESILGELRAGIDADENSNFNKHTDGRLNSAGAYVSGVTQIGNGLHITRRSGTFNINTPSPSLLNAFTTEIQDIADLPSQCINGYTIKIRNSEATEDDYYVRFIADNYRNGTGVWEECPEPGRKVAFDENTMPIQLVRNADGTFTLDEIDWQICIAGNEVTVPEPSFIGKTITKMMFWRNRMLLLSDENVIMSQPGEYFNYWPKSSITYTASDVIDISVSSEFPAIIYDGALTNSGLLLFSKNQQYLLTTDSDVLSPQTAKINTIATYNFNFNTNPISLGTTTAFLDNAGKFSRLWEMANVLREGEPIVVDQTKVVSKLFAKDLELISNSRENSIIFFSQKNSSTLYGYKYFNTSEKRLQQSWFTWELPGTIQHHAVLDDALYIVLRNNSKDTLQKIAIKMDDGTFTAVDDKDTTDTLDDVTYRVHLDTAKEVAIGNVYNSGTNKTTFSKPDGFESPTAQLVVYNNNPDSFDIGSYALATVNGSNVEITGDWGNQSKVVLGYNYDMEIKFPTIYYTQQTGENIVIDTNGSLIIHRLKLNFGGSGSYVTTLDRAGKASTNYTESREAPLSDQYSSDQLAVNDFITQIVPVYERNKNFNLILKSTHPTPATLHSMSWEGDYTTNYYQRV